MTRKIDTGELPGRLPPIDRERLKNVSVSPRYPAVNIKVYGDKDRRGPDNNIRVWLDKEGRLHIRVEKAKRCYQFAGMYDCDGFVELVQVCLLYTSPSPRD